MDDVDRGSSLTVNHGHVTASLSCSHLTIHVEPGYASHCGSFSRRLMSLRLALVGTNTVSSVESSIVCSPGLCEQEGTLFETLMESYCLVALCKENIWTSPYRNHVTE